MLSCHPNNCVGCELHKTRKQIVHSVLPDNADVLFLGEAPGQEEDDSGIPFVGQAGRLLSEVIMEVGLRRDDLAIANIISCRPPENRQPLPKERSACFSYLEREILNLKPKVIVCLGNIPLKQILPEIKGTITKVRGQWFISDKYNCRVLPTFHPSYILHDNQQERVKLVRDLSKIKPFLAGDSEQKISTQYCIVENKSQFDWLIKHLNQESCWAIDTETTSKDFLSAEIFIITFSWRKATAVLVDLRKPFFVVNKEYVWSELGRIFSNDRKKIMQNGSYDIKVLMKYGIIVNNFDSDTVLMHHLLDENRKHSLDLLAYEFTDCGGYDIPLEQYKTKTGVESYADIPNEIIYPYALTDADVTLRSYEAMLPKIYEEGLDFVLFNITMPAQRRLIKTEYVGVKIDIEHLDKTAKKYEEKMKEEMFKVLQVEEVRKYVKDKKEFLRQKFIEKYRASSNIQKRFGNYDLYLYSLPSDKLGFEFNVNSSLQMRELLLDRMGLPVIKYTKNGRSTTTNPSLDAEVLIEYAKKNKFCLHLSNYRSFAQLKSTFLDGIKARLGSDGNAHTNYLLFGTTTGRPSSRDPNLNNIPTTGTAEDIKDIFVADDGCWLVEVDGSQIEFRMWINDSQDPQALRDLELGYDIHNMTGATIVGKDLPKGDLTREQYEELVAGVTKEMRRKAKKTTFGLMYGQGAEGTATRNDLTIAQANKIISSFFGRYPHASRHLVRTVAIARRDGYAKSLFGRKRRLPYIRGNDRAKRAEAERQAKNSSIQATASDLTFLALERISKVLDERNMKTRLVLTVYDSLIFNVPTNELEFVTHLIYDEMTRKASDQIIIPLDADINVGKSWGSLIELDMHEKNWDSLYNILQEHVKGTKYAL